MTELITPDKQPDIAEVKFRIPDISGGDHEFIQDVITDLYVALEDSAEPLHSVSKVAFIPLSKPSNINPDSKKVATVIDLSISSQRSDYAESSRSTHSITSSFKTFHSEHRRHTLLEVISADNVSNDNVAASTRLESINHQLELESTISLGQLAQSLAKLTGIQTIRELGDSAKDNLAVSVINKIFEEIASENNASSYVLGEISRYKVYGNKILDMGGTVSDYDSEREATLSVIESKNPSARSVGLTAVALVNLYEKGIITQQFDYRYFTGHGHKDKTTAVVTLSSRDFSKRALHKLAISKDFDIIKSTMASIKLLQEIPGFKN